MTIVAGKTEGGNALLSGTAGLGDRALRPIGWNKMDPEVSPDAADALVFLPTLAISSGLMASPPTVTLVRDAGIAAQFASRVDVGPTDSRLLSTANMVISDPGWVADGALPWSVVGDAVNTENQRQPGGAQMHTIFTDADKIAVKVFAFQGTPKMQFKVNGELVSATPVTVPIDSAYAWYVFTIAGTREPRLVTALIFGETMMFCGFSVGATAAVFQCPRPRRDMLAGDSYVFGQGLSTPTDTFPVKFAEKLGSLNVWASGVGGTGWLADNGGVFQTLRQRIDSDIVPYLQQGDRLWVLMGTNDWPGGFTADEVVLEASLTLLELQTKLPGVEIIAATPWRPRAGANANNAYDDTVLAGLQAMNIRVIDVRNVFTGSGKVGSTTGVGNSDIAIQADGVHPTAVGAGIAVAFLTANA